MKEYDLFDKDGNKIGKAVSNETPGTAMITAWEEERRAERKAKEQIRASHYFAASYGIESSKKWVEEYEKEKKIKNENHKRARRKKRIEYFIGLLICMWLAPSFGPFLFLLSAGGAIIFFIKLVKTIGS